jgi:hypothetical protein
MKINKVLFSCSDSPDYTPFWEVQSKIYRECLGIEPVCLLFGKKSKTGMTEKYGTIVEMEADPNLPWSVQMVWSKFDYPTREPDTTWLIGDIDLVPLQRAHFIDRVASIPDNAYAHLNAGGISQPRLGRMDGFINDGPERVAKDRGRSGGADLPGHYHAAKGKTFEWLTQCRPFLLQVQRIVTSDRYGLGVMSNQPKSQIKDNPYWYYWCAEENYSSDLIWTAFKNKQLNFVPLYYNNGNDTDRINRDVFVNNDYVYSVPKLKAGVYVDIHCARPYASQHDALARIIHHAWGL